MHVANALLCYCAVALLRCCTAAAAYTYSFLQLHSAFCCCFFCFGYKSSLFPSLFMLSDKDLALAIVIVRAAKCHNIPPRDYARVIIDLHHYRQYSDDIILRRITPAKAHIFLGAYLRLSRYVFLDLNPELCFTSLPQAIFHRFKMTGQFLNWMRIFDSLEYSLAASCILESHQQRAHILKMYSLSLSKIAEQNHLARVVRRLHQSSLTGILQLSIFRHTKVFSDNSRVTKHALSTLARKQKNTRLEKKLCTLAPFLGQTKHFNSSDWTRLIPKIHSEQAILQLLRVLHLSSKVSPVPIGHKSAILCVLLVSNNPDFIQEAYGLMNSIAFLDKT